MAEHDISITVNGQGESLTVESRTLLVHALRDQLGYTAPNVGCESGKCGACTVRLDGDAVKSCTLLAVQADGSEVVTAGGLADETDEIDGAVVADEADEAVEADEADEAVVADEADEAVVAGDADEGGDLHPIQAAFHEEHGLQCGYCTPGMLMTTEQLLAENPDPSREEIRRALKGNVCRCTGYANIVDAVETAAERLEGAATADAESAPAGAGEDD